jgi:putative FmdB family regulatory protein
MPEYHFVCKDCKKPFSKVLTLSEYETAKITCPKCGSREVEQQISPSYTSPRSKSSAQQNSVPPSQSETFGERVNFSASEEDDRARVLSDWEGEGGASRAEKEADNTAEPPSLLPVATARKALP